MLERRKRPRRAWVSFCLASLIVPSASSSQHFESSARQQKDASFDRKSSNRVIAVEHTHYHDSHRRLDQNNEQATNDDANAKNNNANDDQNQQNNNADDATAAQQAQTDDGNQNQQTANGDDANNAAAAAEDSGAAADGYDDQVADDQIADDDTPVKTYDDFYAYQEDPGPPTLFPLTPREIMGFFLASLALCLGASGGLGGGGIVVPVYILVMGLPLKVAVPCGAVTILGGSIGSTILNRNRRHPLADRPIIDWDLVLVMEPLTLVGTTLGTLFHRALSDKFLVVLLVLLLSVTAHTTLAKAMRMYHAEKRYIRHLKAAQAPPPSGTPPGDAVYTAWTDDMDGIQRLPQRADEKERILILNPDYITLRSDLIEQEKFTPRTKIIALVLMFSILIFLNVMVGGGQYKSPWDIQCGSVAFYTVQCCMIAFLIASAWAAQTYVIARHEIKDLVRFDYVHGDIIWNAKSAVLYPLIFVSAGIFAGALGIGGGIIIVPLLLHIGLHPTVASATSSAMILFTSFSSTTSFIVFGLLLPDFAITGFCIGFLAALIGQTIMRQARQATSASGRNFERNSYIAFVIGGIVLISALLMTIQYVLLIVEEPDNSDSGVCDGLSF